MRTCEVCGRVGTINWKCKACKKNYFKSYHLLHAEESKIRFKENYRKENAEQRAKRHKACKELRDSYIIERLKSVHGCNIVISEELIALKRAALLLRRIKVIDTELPTPYDPAVTEWFVNENPVRQGWYERISGGVIEKDYYKTTTGKWCNSNYNKLSKNLQGLPWRGLYSKHKMCENCKDTLDISNFDSRVGNARCPVTYRNTCNSCKAIKNAN